jgi:hypothetical protein
MHDYLSIGTENSNDSPLSWLRIANNLNCVSFPKYVITCLQTPIFLFS